MTRFENKCFNFSSEFKRIIVHYFILQDYNSSIFGV